VLAEGGGLSRGDDFHLRGDRDGHGNFPRAGALEPGRSGSSLRHGTCSPAPKSEGRVAVSGSRQKAVYRTPPAPASARAHRPEAPRGGWPARRPQVRSRGLFSSLRRWTRARVLPDAAARSFGRNSLRNRVLAVRDPSALIGTYRNTMTQYR